MRFHSKKNLLRTVGIVAFVAVLIGLVNSTAFAQEERFTTEQIVVQIDTI